MRIPWVPPRLAAALAVLAAALALVAAVALPAAMANPPEPDRPELIGLSFNNVGGVTMYVQVGQDPWIPLPDTWIEVPRGARVTITAETYHWSDSGGWECVFEARHWDEHVYSDGEQDSVTSEQWLDRDSAGPWVSHEFTVSTDPTVAYMGADFLYQSFGVWGCDGPPPVTRPLAPL